MATLFWLVVFLGACFALIYNRVELRLSTAILGAVLVAFTSFSGAGFFWLFILWVLFAGFALLNVEALRRERISAPILDVLRKLLPRLSDTERAALEAGSVWWEGELFSGMPDWRQLSRLPAPKLTEAEQAFLDGPTEELCALAEEWPITHDLQDLPEPVWDFIREKGFFSLIIPEEYGGKGFSPLAISMILAKLASRSGTASTMVGVPNSLGPGELLLHYGTEEQKQRWLPGLASAEEIPCFALTSIHAGSDATGLIDSGVVCKGEFDGEEIVGIRLNWDKRYITLAPVATVLGLAFKLYDPDHLIGDRDEYGITAALIPTDLPGVEIGNRHLPIGIPFQNGPTRGKDVFLPLDCIIGGKEMAGEGWRMLVELLSAGRGIVLPSNAVGGAMAAVHATGAYARIRRQFKVPIGEFHGIGEALARMTGYTYIMTAASRVTCAALNEGEKPAVPTAILKYHNTEMSRRVANDAMDIHGGKGVMRGPTNYLATAYASLPISITVEGANILTRNLIIFGQGAIRCHPYVLREMQAAADEDPGRALETFDRLIFGHVGYTLSNALRSFVLGLTHGRLSGTPTQRPGGTLLPAHQPLQRRVRAGVRRIHVPGRRRIETQGTAIGPPGRHPELPLSRLHGPEAPPGSEQPRRRRPAGGMELPHPDVQGTAATGRTAAQPPEPMGRGTVANTDLPARQDLLPAGRQARPADRRSRHPSHRGPKPPLRRHLRGPRARQSAWPIAGST